MAYSLAAALFQSETRTRLLELLFLQSVVGSVSELARRAEVSVRAMAKEVEHLSATGLVAVDAAGASTVLRANHGHPTATALRALLHAPAVRPPDADHRLKVRESLAAWGAPFAGVAPRRTLALAESLLAGLELGRQDGTVLRALPTVLAAQRDSVDWPELGELARRRKLKAELGMLVEVTADLLGQEDLRARVEALKDRRRRAGRFYPEARSHFEEELAKRRTQRAAKRWGFLTNLTFAIQGRSSADLQSFLQRVDGELRRPCTIVAIGGATVALGHGGTHAAAALDLWTVSDSAFWSAAQRINAGPGEPVVVQRAAVAEPPPSFEDRLVSLELKGLRHLTIQVPEAHDLALLKAARGEAHDLDAIEDIHRHHPLDLATLVERHRHTAPRVPGDRELYRLGFLSALVRLFGEGSTAGL